MVEVGTQFQMQWSMHGGINFAEKYEVLKIDKELNTVLTKCSGNGYHLFMYDKDLGGHKCLINLLKEQNTIGKIYTTIEEKING